MKASPPFLVLRDSREQQGWTFPESGRCQGTEVRCLKTGDYSLEGWEDKFVIERKRSTAEISANLFQARFHRELDRLDEFEHAYLFCEFELEDVVLFPSNSGIPPKLWKSLKVTPQLLMAKLMEVQVAHPRLKVWFVGRRGREAASSLFKRIAEHVA